MQDATESALASEKGYVGTVGYRVKTKAGIGGVGRKSIACSAEDDLVQDDADIDRNQGDCPGRSR